MSITAVRTAAELSESNDQAKLKILEEAMNLNDSTNDQKRAIGVFARYQDAEDALLVLRDEGFAMNQVSVIARDSDRMANSSQIGETNVHDLNDTTRVDEGAKTGAATGGAVGGLTGLLVGLGTLAIPGIGPVMLAGAAATALATTVAGGALGAAAGSLAGALIGLGIPEDRARLYNEQVEQGGYLVMIDGTAAQISRAEALLKRAGIRDWEVHPSPMPSGSTTPVEMNPNVRL
jgi:hypothetical protein